MLVYCPTFIINKYNNDKSKSEPFDVRVRESSFYIKACVVFLTSVDEFLSVYNDLDIGYNYRLLIHPSLVGNTEIKLEHLSYAKKLLASLQNHTDFGGVSIPLISESTTLQADTERTRKSFHNYFGFDIYDLTQSGSKDFIASLPVFQKGAKRELTNNNNNNNVSETNPKITILTALTEAEYSSFRENINEEKTINGILTAKFKKDDNYLNDYQHNIDFVRHENGIMGSVESALNSQKIFTNGTDILIMSGVCGGREGKVKTYDIIISEKIIDIFTGSYEGNEFFPYSYDEKTNARLISFLSETNRILKIKNQMLTLIPDNDFYKRKREILSNINIEFGIMACGPFVLKTGGFLNSKSEEINNKIIGFEMESYGVMRATNILNDPTKIGLVVKSVMDYTDKNKKDSENGEPVKEIAAFMSYLCVRVLIPYIDEFYKKEILNK
jgi:nucleoside phosphorylase